MASFAAQNRAITREDYIARTYAMPARFGSVAKAYIVPDTQLNAAELEIKSKKIELEENEQILDILKSGAEEEFKKQKSNLDREARKEIKVMDILAKLGIEEDKLTASQKKNFEDKLLGILRDEEMVELNTLSQLAINAEKEKDK